MHISFIGKVGAPKEVLPNVPFNIRWRIWYISIPFIKFNIRIKLNRDEELFNKTKTIIPLFFFGLVRSEVDDSIGEDKKYKLSMESW